MSIHRSLKALATLTALGFSLEAASAEPAAPAQPMWFSSASDEVTAFGEQYVREVSLDMCSWTNRPTNSVCTAQNPSDYWSTWNRNNAVPCGPSTGPAPSTYWFDYTASQACVIDPYTGCRTQRWEWSDGRMVSGSGNPVLHCPSNPANMGTGLFTKVLVSTVSQHVFMRLPGFFTHIQPQYVRGQVLLAAVANSPIFPSGLPAQSMSFILALQEKTVNGQWQDIGVQEVWAQSPSAPYAYTWYEVAALVQPYTEVRVELRANVVPPLRVANENNIYENYRLDIDLIDARLILPECIPDMSNPGQCL